MIGFKHDDGGRAASGRRGTVGDCVVRAAAIASGRPYDVVYRLASAEMKRVTEKRSARNGVAKRACDALYQQLGLVKVRLPSGPRPTYSEAHRLYGDCVVSTAKHHAALVGGYLRDLFDGRTYVLLQSDGSRNRHERKAQSVWAARGRETAPGQGEANRG